MDDAAGEVDLVLIGEGQARVLDEDVGDDFGRLGDAGRLNSYRVLFLGCAAEMAPATPTIPSLEKFIPISILHDATYLENVKKNLREFVETGGLAAPRIRKLISPGVVE